MANLEILDLKSVFERWALEGLEQEMASVHRRTANDVLSRIPLSPGDRILDVGTGNGFAARTLASQEPHAQVYGLDLSPNMVRSANSHESESRIEYIIGEMHSYPFKDNSFGYVFMMDVIEYSPDPEQALREIHRVLRPEGQLYCANLFYKEVVNIQPELADRDGIQLCWGKDEFRKAFRTSGFTSIQQTHIPDTEVTIPSEESCKQMGWDSRTQAETVYRDLGALLTTGVVD
ncbi:class I SAM-dependent methyltransferase [Halarchaeum nitratireducens]|nr:class I SAM-dependent methyltransferase [Halarchaeum nitratireducens]